MEKSNFKEKKVIFMYVHKGNVPPTQPPISKQTFFPNNIHGIKDKHCIFFSGTQVPKQQMEDEQ